MPFKKFASVILMAFVFMFVGTLLNAQSASAANLAMSPSSDEKIQKLLLNRAVGKCMQTSNLSGGFGFENGYRIGAEAAIDGDWFMSVGTSYEATTGPYMKNTGINDQSENSRCGSKEMIQRFLSVYKTGGLDVLCGIGFKRSDGSTPCKAGNGVLEDGNPSYGARAEEFRKKYPESAIGMGDQDWYWFYRKTFNWSCGEGKMVSGLINEADYNNSNGANGFGYRLIYVTTEENPTPPVSGQPHAKWLYVSGAKKRSDNVNTRLGEGPGYSTVTMSCAQIEERLNHYGRIVAAQTADKPADQIEREQAEGVAAGASDGQGTAPEDSETSCQIEGLGWFICPAISLMATATDSLWGWISNFMKVQPLNVDTASNENTMYIAWKAMRDVANVAFVIAFIIIVYSQLTGVGVSNYGVKKLLPRLIVAAVLVNASYWVAAIAVDISNILGNNIYNVLRNGIDLGDVTIEGQNWEVITSYILSAGTVVGGVLFGKFALTQELAGSIGQVALWALVVFVLAVVLALLIAFIILAVRQALIIILIVLSPLAFVAMLLPNTEKFFTLWRKSLTTLLVFYPLFAVLFGGSFLAGYIIIGSAASNDSPDTPMLMTYMVGMAVMILPLWLTPLVMRFSTGILGQVAGMVNNKSKGFVDRARNVRNRKAALAGNEIMQKTGQRNPFGRAYRAIQNSGKRDQDRRKIIDANNQNEYLGSAKGEELATKLANAGHVTATLEGELKARIEAQKDTNLTMRQEAADLEVKAIHAEHGAEFAEIKAGGEVHADTTTAEGQAFARSMQGVAASQRALDVNGSRARIAEGVVQQNFAEALRTNADLAAEAGGTVDPSGASRVVASAINAQSARESENIKAAGTVLKDANLSRDQIRDLSRGMPALDAAGQPVPNFGGGNFDMQAAAIQQAVASNDVEAINTLWNDSRNWQGEEGSRLRSTLADSLQASGGRPAYYGQGAIASLRTNEHQSAHETVMRAIESNAYSAQRIAGADQEELNVLAQVLAEQHAMPATGPLEQGQRRLSDDVVQQVLANAEQALTDPRISPTIGKNLDQVRNIQGFRAPAAGSRIEYRENPRRNRDNDAGRFDIPRQ